jgi:hypothetical protein
VTRGALASRRTQLSVRVEPLTARAVRSLARAQRLSVSQLFRSWIARAIDEEHSDSELSESAIRETAILIAVELGLKLHELSLPGGAAHSRELLEAAARAAMQRLDMVEASLDRGAQQ